jgi:periplasmic divalent cation tolerance protein
MSNGYMKTGLKEIIQVITTTETKADAQAIAHALVEKRLAACVQIIGPITSTYWWRGEIETAEE